MENTLPQTCPLAADSVMYFCQLLDVLPAALDISESSDDGADLALLAGKQAGVYAEWMDVSSPGNTLTSPLRASTKTPSSILKRSAPYAAASNRVRDPLPAESRQRLSNSLSRNSEAKDRTGSAVESGSVATCDITDSDSDTSREEGASWGKGGGAVGGDVGGARALGTPSLSLEETRDMDTEEFMSTVDKTLRRLEKVERRKARLRCVRDVKAPLSRQSPPVIRLCFLTSQQVKGAECCSCKLQGQSAASAAKVERSKALLFESMVSIHSCPPPTPS